MVGKVIGAVFDHTHANLAKLLCAPMRHASDASVLGWLNR
jgi:hypothetical protein